MTTSGQSGCSCPKPSGLSDDWPGAGPGDLKWQTEARRRKTAQAPSPTIAVAAAILEPERADRPSWALAVGNVIPNVINLPIPVVADALNPVGCDGAAKAGVIYQPADSFGHRCGRWLGE